eukprot:Hpha_TRINITY_DN15826_c3_g1::TRINITY_DN15826_c3_g1_i1::g.190090::m.190090
MCTPPGDGLFGQPAIQNRSFCSAPDLRDEVLVGLIPSPRHISMVVQGRTRRRSTRTRRMTGAHSGKLLQGEWQFWVERGDAAAESLGCFQNIKMFWQFHKAIEADDDLSQSRGVYLFRSNVVPPPMTGGYFAIRCCTRNQTHKLWHDVAMVLIGEQFDAASRVLGAVFNVHALVIHFWLDSTSEQVRTSIKRQLQCLVPQRSQLSSFRECNGSRSQANSPMQAAAPSFDEPPHPTGCPRTVSVPAAPPVSERTTWATRSFVPDGRARSNSLPASLREACEDCPHLDVVMQRSPSRPEAATTDEIIIRRGLPPGMGLERPRANTDALDIMRAQRAQLEAELEAVVELETLASRRRQNSRGAAARPRAQTMTAAESNMRKVMSAADLEEIVPDEPLFKSMQGHGMKNVESWPGDLDASDATSRRAPAPPSSSHPHSDGQSGGSSIMSAHSHSHSHHSHQRASPDDRGRRVSVNSGSASPAPYPPGFQLPSPSRVRRQQLCEEPPEDTPRSHWSGPPSLGKYSAPMSPNNPAAQAAQERRSPSPSLSGPPCASAFSSAATPPLLLQSIGHQGLP